MITARVSVPLRIAAVVFGVGALALGPHVPTSFGSEGARSADADVAAPAQSYRSPAGRHKVRTTSANDASDVVRAGGKLVADYGAFQVLDVDRDADRLGLRDGAVEGHDEDNVIWLNAGPIDTTTPHAAALRKAAGTFPGKRMHLVQFAGPIQHEWYDALVATGITVVTYIPSNSYLLYGDDATIARVESFSRASSFVQWDADYADSYRIDPDALAPDVVRFSVQLVVDESTNADTLALLDSLRLEPMAEPHRVLNYLDVTVRLAPASLAAVAARPDVVSIQPALRPELLDERQAMIVSGFLNGNVPSGPGYLKFLTSKGFRAGQFAGSGFAVDVTDEGIDNGTTTPNHFGLYGGGDLTGTSRVVYNRLEGTPNGGSTIQGCDGHGTLNAHIIGGFNDRSDVPHVDASGFHYGLGIAPFVRVAGSVIFDPGFTSPNFANLQAEAYRDGARISSNSWGDNFTRGKYNPDSQAYDALVRDAQPTASTVPTAGNQEMVIVFAAGNAGSNAMSVNAPATAKNVITVAAGENVQQFGGADASGVGDSGSDNANDIIDFSSRGPCKDGRKKPDLTAPGTHVSGGVFQATANAGGTGQAAACFNAGGVSGGPNGSDYWPLGQQFYSASSGTSHSCPAVAGGAALVRQYFLNAGRTAPSPAMTKAYLMNSTRYMTGVSANDALWSPNQGMGEMNLGFAFDNVARTLYDERPEDLFTATAQSRVFTGTVTDSTKPFRVTLAWTDAPGATTGNAYNNNLDLTVTVGGQTYKGNVFSGQSSVTGGVADAADNVESVFLPAGVSGAYTITVTASNINSDGVPGNATGLDQDFSLVIYDSGTSLQRTVHDTPGLYVAGTGTFFLRNSNSSGVADIAAQYAGTGVTPIVGDWDGNGTDTLGVYNSASSAFFLRNSNSPGAADTVAVFGAGGVGYTPVVGDWNGDGTTTIGLFDPVNSVFFLKNSNTAGNADIVVAFGPPGVGWMPIVGDWDGNGTTTVGLYNPLNGAFFLKNSNTNGPADTIVIFGAGGAALPLAGDWNNDGVDTIGIYDPNTGAFFLRNSNAPGNADVVFVFGAGGQTPLAGDWTGQ